MESSEMIPVRRQKTKAAKVIPDILRRYGGSEAKHEEQVLDVPQGAEIEVDGVWDGGYLSAHWQGHSFPVSYDEVPSGFYQKLLKKYSGPRVKCPKCEGGWRIEFEEGAGDIRTPCYHCGNSGFITEDEYFKDRLRGVAESLSWDIVHARIAARNADPEGEDWRFCAAENMMNEHDYTLAVQIGEEDRVVRVFETLISDGCGDVIRAIVNKLAPPDPKAYITEQVEGDKPPPDRAVPPIRSKVRATEDIQFLLPRPTKDGTHGVIKKGSLGKVAHVFDDSEIVVDFDNGQTVYVHCGCVEVVPEGKKAPEPKPQPVPQTAWKPPEGYTEDDIPF